MNKLIIVALLAIIAVSTAMMPMNGRFRGTGLRFPAWRKNRHVVAEDEADEEESDFWMALAPLAFNLIKNKLAKKDDFEEESDFINFKKIWGVAKDIGKSYLSSKYGINLDDEEEEEESDSEASPLTVAQLQAIMPTLSSSKANEMIGYLNAALNEFSINTCARRSAFLAQLAAYEGRKYLGNTHPGDGKRYKGRGPIQLTGRANYRSAGSALGLNLEANPTQAATPQVGFRIAGWFWSTRSLNSLADQRTQASFDQITRRINGGTNGKADRDQFWRKAKSVLS